MGFGSDTIADGNVSDARVHYYDTKVYFRGDYDEQLRRTIPTASGEIREGRAILPNDPQPNRGSKAGPEPAGDIYGIGETPPRVPAAGESAAQVKKPISPR